MGHKNTIFLALVVALITQEAMAEQHVVGGSQGWDESTDFNSWVILVMFFFFFYV